MAIKSGFVMGNGTEKMDLLSNMPTATRNGIVMERNVILDNVELEIIKKSHNRIFLAGPNGPRVHVWTDRQYCRQLIVNNDQSTGECMP